jgi:hypothetical protein
MRLISQSNTFQKIVFSLSEQALESLFMPHQNIISRCLNYIKIHVKQLLMRTNEVGQFVNTLLLLEAV